MFFFFRKVKFIQMGVGYYAQMVAAFLLLSLGHFFAAAFLPIADCDETYNFVEPVHYLLYGTGKQTWENCPQYALRSWLFAWMYAWPAVLVKGMQTLSAVHVYYYLRILVGRIACLCELFFVYSVWRRFSGKHAVLALLLLLLNYPIPHAAVSLLPTSYVMCVYFIVLGCWLRSGTASAASLRAASGEEKKKKTAVHGAAASATASSARAYRCYVVATVFLVVAACMVGWPFAGLLAVPIGLDLLFRFPLLSSICLISSMAVVAGASVAVDSQYYCRPTLSAWNVVTYNLFGGDERGPDLYGTEPWYFLIKNLLLNFHLVFLASVAAPTVVLLQRKAKTGGLVSFGSSTGGCASATVEGGVSRGRQLLYISPYFLWVGFWLIIPHKEERFLSPAFPFMVLAAVQGLQICFPSCNDSGTADSSSTSHRASAWGSAACAETNGRPLWGRAVHSSAAASEEGGSGNGGAARSPRGVSQGKLRKAGVVFGVVFLFTFGCVSMMRSLAVYNFYSGPERLFYDWFSVIQAESEAKVVALSAPSSPSLSVADQRYTVCVGKEWYRMPPSFFIDTRVTNVHFLRMHGRTSLLPVEFKTAGASGCVSGILRSCGRSEQGTAMITETADAGSCTCNAARMNDMNKEIPEQYVQGDPVEACDAVFDSLSPAGSVSRATADAEAAELHLGTFRVSLLSRRLHEATMQALRHKGVEEERGTRSSRQGLVDDHYAVIDVDRTPLWCRVLYYPLGISRRCVVWRPLVLRVKEVRSQTQTLMGV